MGRMDGKVALITGGARGQGRAHAIRFAEEGADIILTDICEDIPEVRYPMGTRAELDETVAMVEKLDRRCVAYQADSRDAARMKEVVAAGVAELGGLTTVLINHGIGIAHSVEDDDAVALWDTVIATNLSAVFKVAAAVIPHLRAKGGSITITGSASSLVTIYGNPSYTAAKHGIIGLMKSLAADYADDWIRVNAVCPTGIPTKLFINDYNLHRFSPHLENPTADDMRFPAQSLNMLPVPWIEPEAISNAMLYLASDEAKYVTGVALPVDAGMVVQPPGITPQIGRRLAELGG